MSEPLADVLAARLLNDPPEPPLPGEMPQIIAALRLADAVAKFDESDSDEDGEELDNALTSYRRKRDAAK